ncbi:Pyroglutamyl-peptidase [Lachnellula occidentalis]|uniref:Pyroglutamyl-peptidase n=1 Tax=Lachnellula occidentalis TaxID=215460 RepID=A0A8H8UC36_9HELO|nr:Pyroglutamyl-peptidase [Lachnellula occidentalis]
MAQEDYDLTVLVTGFGEFQDIKTNPSFEITSLLPPQISHKGLTIRLISHPEPLNTAYHSILSTIPPLLEQHKPDIVLHIGLAVERNYFAIEKSALRDGYQQYPDIARKVFTKAESKKTWGKSPERLETTLDFDDVVDRWQKGVWKADVRGSDDVGNYICGFIYYLSLEHFWEKGDGDGEKKVLFLHVPHLKGEKELEKGKEITVNLIKAIAESCRR